MKTKEDILDEHLKRGKVMYRKDEYIDDYGVHDFIYEALDEWAKQQILAFDIYKRDNHFIFEYAGQKYMRFGAAYVHERRLSLDELYAQFIDNQNTNQ